MEIRLLPFLWLVFPFLLRNGVSRLGELVVATTLIVLRYLLAWEFCFHEAPLSSNHGAEHTNEISDEAAGFV